MFSIHGNGLRTFTCKGWVNILLQERKQNAVLLRLKRRKNFVERRFVAAERSFVKRLSNDKENK